jgi:hypothetical protein
MTFSNSRWRACSLLTDSTFQGASEYQPSRISSHFTGNRVRSGVWHRALVERRVFHVSHMFRIALLFFAGCDACAFAQQTVRTASDSAAPKGNVVLVSLFKPVYPPLARQANIAGKVSVTVTVHQNGTTEAVTESGHPLLRQAALDSATQSHFECRGCGVSLSYLLVYTFKQVSAGDCCSASSMPPQVEQESPTTDQQGQPLTYITIAALHSCLCDPTFTVTKQRARSLKCLYLWKCSFR